jgi:hypothetical protein
MASRMMGPKYNYADELTPPSQIGVRKGGSFGAIMGSMVGFNYYIDAIGFGESTGMAKNARKRNKALGIRYYMKTGQTCSNGADMYEYIDNIPKGLPGRPGKEVESALGVKLRGLAPGIMEDAAVALNPVRLFNAAIESPYSKCKKVSMPVGDEDGKMVSWDGKEKWIDGKIDSYQTLNRRRLPFQTRWVFDKAISKEEYDSTPKTEGKKEGFTINDPSLQTIAAGVLLAGLAVGVAMHMGRRS